MNKMLRELTELQSKTNQYLVWPPFDFKTAYVILGTLIYSFFHTCLKRLHSTVYLLSILMPWTFCGSRNFITLPGLDVHTQVMLRQWLSIVKICYGKVVNFGVVFLIEQENVWTRRLKWTSLEHQLFLLCLLVIHPPTIYAVCFRCQKSFPLVTPPPQTLKPPEQVT